MTLKNQLTKTPYLVLFIVLISIGVGTASALVTITLSGDVVITDSLTVDTDTLVVDSPNDKVGIGVANPTEKLDVNGSVLVRDVLFIGTDNGEDNDVICFDDPGCFETLGWNNDYTQFQFSDAIVTGGVIQAGNFGPHVDYNRIGPGLAESGFVASSNDLFVYDDIESGGEIIGGNNLRIGIADQNDDDAICFDDISCTKNIKWVDGNDQFEISDDAAVVGDFQVQGQTDVSGGPIISTRSTSEGNTSNLVIQRTEGATAETPSFALSHRTSDKDLWLYGFDGSTFKNFVGFDYPNYKINFPATGNTLVVDAATDKVGIGTDSPSSELDVVGDIELSGKLIGQNIFSFYQEEWGSPLTDGSNFETFVVSCDAEDIVVTHKFSLPDSSYLPLQFGIADDSFNQITYTFHNTENRVNDLLVGQVVCWDLSPFRE